MRYLTTPNQRAFTLIEIIVSLSIFAIVAVVALGALVKIVTANKKAQTIAASVTNINYALETMSREIRVGRNYYCVSGPASSFNPINATLVEDYTTNTKCPSGVSDSTSGTNGTVVAFLSTKVDRDTDPNNPCNLIYAYAFEYSAGTYLLKKAEQTACGNSTYTFEPILDPNVTLTGYYVRVTAAALPGGNPFPHVTMRISGYAGVQEKDKTYFDVQTSIAGRVQ